jgi:hypothetical protein
LGTNLLLETKSLIYKGLTVYLVLSIFPFLLLFLQIQ